ncbi:cysteine desulfurase family protein [Salinisphaera sp. Q1T1-3]|uniref:cysteine desulfurase family protein n=1 Tax=Salinisphaera sp. Q1T1-3 TaxID=2321229 RepID=UPI001314B044|nr:cysteine desulfurase family protein [Salinisphaera sp. Q1T1-3]
MDADIYLDHAATTPLGAAGRAAMLAVFDDASANPSALHRPGERAAAHIATAEQALASAINAPAGSLVWTSGATEATNLAIRGVIEFAARGRDIAQRPLHIVSCETEHAATRDLLRHLSGRADVTVTWLGVDGDGMLAPGALDTALAAGADLVSLMHVNNETGAIHDIPAIAARCAEAGVPLHVDAAQSLGRLPIDVTATPIALMSMSAHKLGGPPGIGALYVRKRPRVGLAPQILGGGQQNGRRAGTLPTHQIAAFGAAVAATQAESAAGQASLGRLRDRLWAALSALDGVTRNGPTDTRVAAPFLNVSVEGVHGEALRTGLAHGSPAVAVSGGAACSAARGQSSYVLRAMGCAPRDAAASVRFSLGMDTDEAGVDAAAARFIAEVVRLRRLAAAL